MRFDLEIWRTRGSAGDRPQRCRHPLRVLWTARDRASAQTLHVILADVSASALLVLRLPQKPLRTCCSRQAAAIMACVDRPRAVAHTRAVSTRTCPRASWCVRTLGEGAADLRAGRGEDSPGEPSLWRSAVVVVEVTWDRWRPVTARGCAGGGCTVQAARLSCGRDCLRAVASAAGLRTIEASGSRTARRSPATALRSETAVALLRHGVCIHFRRHCGARAPVPAALLAPVLCSHAHSSRSSRSRRVRRDVAANELTDQARCRCCSRASRTTRKS